MTVIKLILGHVIILQISYLILTQVSLSTSQNLPLPKGTIPSGLNPDPVPDLTTQNLPSLPTQPNFGPSDFPSRPNISQSFPLPPGSLGQTWSPPPRPNTSVWSPPQPNGGQRWPPPRNSPNELPYSSGQFSPGENGQGPPQQQYFGRQFGQFDGPQIFGGTFTWTQPLGMDWQEMRGKVRGCRRICMTNWNTCQSSKGCRVEDGLCSTECDDASDICLRGCTRSWRGQGGGAWVRTWGGGGGGGGCWRAHMTCLSQCEWPDCFGRCSDQVRECREKLWQSRQGRRY